MGLGRQKMIVFSNICCLLWADHAIHLDSEWFFTYRSLAHMAQPKTYGERRNMNIGWKSQDPTATSIYLQLALSGSPYCIVVTIGRVNSGPATSSLLYDKFRNLFKSQ